MDENEYEIMNPENQQELASKSGENFTYNTVNECYQLQQNNGADVGCSRYVNSGGGAVEYACKKGDYSHKRMKSCVIVMSFALVLLTLVSVAALVLAVISFSHSSGELTDKVNLLSSQLNRVRNESQETEKELTNDINFQSIKFQQLVSSTRDNISQVVVDLNTVKNDLSSLPRLQPK